MAYKTSEQVIIQLFLPLRKRELAELEPKFEKLDLLNGTIFAKELFCKDIAGIPWSVIESYRVF